MVTVSVHIETSASAGDTIEGGVPDSPAPSQARSADYTAIVESGLFDADWYRVRNDDVSAAGIDPVEHYLNHGGREGRPAGPNFHSAAYYAVNTDVARAGMNPLLHYVLHGLAEGRHYTSVEEFEVSFGGHYEPGMDRSVAQIASSPLFDPRWFNKRYPALAATKINPAIHLARHQPGEALNPGPGFCAETYLRVNKDVAELGANPFLHYLNFGEKEGREAHPVTDAKIATSDATADQSSTGDTPAKSRSEKLVGDSSGRPRHSAEVTANLERDRGLVIKSNLFQAQWYAATYAADIPAGMDPIDHFLIDGRGGAFHPSPKFDAGFYLRSHPDVSKSGENPLVHYLRKGRKEGRKIRGLPASYGSVVPATGDGKSPDRAPSVDLDESKALSLLAGTRLFDKAWYITQYSDVAQAGVDPALHYFRFGGAEKTPA